MNLTKTFIDCRIIFPTVLLARGHTIFTDETLTLCGRYRHGVCRMSKLVAFLKNNHGATAIEYGLIAAGISIAIIATVNALGTQLNTSFTSVSTQLH
jgi:pilus assembly protein Flp/PilA